MPRLRPALRLLRWKIKLHSQIDQPLFEWADTPWTVAALLGVWGVMIGIEEFALANVFMGLACLSCAGRLYKDTIRSKARRHLLFTAGILVLVFVFGIDVHLTHRKKVSSDERAQEIPQLEGKIKDLQETVNSQNEKMNREEAQSDQKLSDIESQNMALQEAVATKDAELVAIGREQYSLNFAPQLFVVSTGTTNDQVMIINNGKTNVNVNAIDVEGRPQDAGNAPALIAQGTEITFKLNPRVKDEIAARPVGGTAERMPVECEVLFMTMDRKKYSLKFTWFFTIKEGSIVGTAVVARPIDEIKP